MTILFDLDGTLLDTAPDFAQAVNQLRQEHNLPSLSPNCHGLLRPAVSWGINRILDVLFEQNPTPTQDHPLSDRLLELYVTHLGNHAVLFPGMETLITTLEQRSIPWGIVTNKDSCLTLPLLNKLGLDKRASCIVSGDTTPNPKPHPDPLFYACRHLNIDPKHCVYVGDAERDIVAGKAAGMATIGALFGYIDDIEEARTQWGADHYIHHADEILPWFEAWQTKQTASI